MPKEGFAVVTLKEDVVAKVKAKIAYRGVADFVTKAINEKIAREDLKSRDEAKEGVPTD